MSLPVTLAIDTGHARCQSAVALGDGAIFSLAETLARGHAEVVIGQVENLLGRAGLAYGDLQRVAVTVGPASFTGLRVGLSAALGIGLARDIPVIGVGTLQALSLLVDANAPFTLFVEAGRGEAYLQSFSAPGVPAGPAEAMPVEQARALPGKLIDASGKFVPVERLARFAQTLDPALYPPEPFYVRGPDARPQAGQGIARR